jgi:molybdopterin molybdotransferase
MLSVDQALSLVLEHAHSLPPQAVALKEALGRVLAEDVASDIDSPPHDKSVVDGYAVVAASLMLPPVELKVLEEVTAGVLPTRDVKPGTTTRIMTGAPLPKGADAVVMIEQTETAAADAIRVLQPNVRPGQNIMRRAASLSRGQVVLSRGKRLRAIELGLLAEVGRQEVQVARRPSVAIIATGNELVGVSAVPDAGQIRNSNGPLLTALVEQAGGEAIDLGIARDETDDLRAKVNEGLECDIVVLSGGVSAGVLDLVPQVLRELGVQEVLHKVNLKPGKPLWFGIRRGGSAQQQALVFGLPGNPVSTLVCFELFVRPAIQSMQGEAPIGLARTTATLGREHRQRGERPAYWPAVVREDNGIRSVMPLPWQGSGDLRTLTDANCLAFFPAGDRVFAIGEQVDVLLLPG